MMIAKLQTNSLKTTSPCVRRCELDVNAMCVGCGRKLSEIACWNRLSFAGKAEVARLARHRVKRPAFTVNHSARTSGMTLIELLVVIAIIGVLVSLLLPAVQAAREAARKASCQNNLHQIGISMHAYHDVHKSLPTGCIEWRAWRSPPTYRQFAWSAFLLPFLEQQPLHSSIDFSVPFDHARNASAAKTRLSVYECPTAEKRSFVRGQTDYGGLFGEMILDREQDDGVFLYERSVRFVDIQDGLTNTLAVSEDVGGPDSEWINGRNVFVQSGAINDPNAWIGDNEIRSRHGSGAMVLFVDGRTVFISESLDRFVLGKLITRAKSEVVDSDDF